MKKVWVAAVVVVVIIVAVIYLIQQKSRQTGSKVPEPVGFSFSTTEIRAAVDYGKNHRDDLLVDFEKPWTVFLGYGSGKGSATIFTPYYCLALMARNWAIDNSNMDTESLCRLCAENHKDLYFEVTLYSAENNESGFDRDYKAVILQNGREIPILKAVHLGYDQAREYTIFSQQKLYFPADILREKDKITLRIVKPKEASLDFVFDLKSIL